METHEAIERFLASPGLADSTRRAILVRLARGEASVGELAEPFDISLPAISKHLRVLENAHLVRRTKDGRVRRVTLRPEPMRAASSWIDQLEGLWDEQLDNLARFLEATAPENAPEDADGRRDSDNA